MPYKNKIYVAFDAFSDDTYYRQMKAWKQSDNSYFDFYCAHYKANFRPQNSEEAIKISLNEKLNGTKIFILLVGEKTKSLYNCINWEIEQALILELPIIVVNLNGVREIDNSNCPIVLKDKLALHVSFNSKIIQKSLEDWDTLCKKYSSEKKSGPFFYNVNVYKSFGL